MCRGVAQRQLRRHRVARTSRRAGEFRTQETRTASTSSTSTSRTGGFSLSDPGVYSKLNTSHHRGSSVFCFVEDWALSSVPDTVSVQRGSEEPPLDLWANEPVRRRVDGVELV